MRRLLVRGLAALACAAAGAQAQPPSPPPPPPPTTLRWVVQHMPPHFSYAGGRVPQTLEDLGRGEVDGFLRLLIPRLSEYRHEFVEASTARFESLARQGETLCSVLHVRRPERLDWLYFTHLHPALASREIHVIVHRDSKARFEQAGQTVQLAELLQRRELVGLLPRDRSYGPRIDTLLQAQGANAPKTVATGRGMQLLAMLRAKRMDYTLEYPAAVDEFMQNLGGPPELLKLPLAEGRSTSMAMAACSRTPEGRRRIEAIDRAVRTLAGDPQRERWLREWRGTALDEAERRRLLRYLDERASAGPQIE